MNDIDVAVIGAGVAGLEAAARLGAQGLSVEVFEARERIGGRIWTTRPRGWPRPVEVGAEFIHGGNSALTGLLRAGRIKQREVPERRHWVMADGELRPMPDAWERIDAGMRRIGAGGRGSFGSWLAQHRDEFVEADRTLLEAFVKGFQGAPLRRMSVRTLFAATKSEEEQKRLANGYDRVFEVLRRRIEKAGVVVHTLSAVDQVRWRRGQATVRAAGKEWRARGVVVTVPLGVLKARRGETGAIQFVPGLRRKARLLRGLESGHALRIVCLMRADVWRRGPIPKAMRAGNGRAFGFLHSEEFFFPVWWAEAPSPLLVGWTGGEAAAKMAGWSGERIFSAARRTLAKLFGCTERVLAKSIVDFRTHDWAADVFTRGAYSFSIAGKENAPRELARPVGGTLFFAGEATADPLEQGTVHGALASSARAADEVLAARRKRWR